MDKKDWNLLAVFIGVFGLLYFLPAGSGWFRESTLSAFELLHEYAKEHVLTCLLPALFIAGAIAVMIKKDAVLKYLGHDAKKHISYLVASVSGAILAVCSCTILPLFAGIRKRGAGLGPAITFLFSGPAINIAAIFLTLNVLGAGIGIARIISAILISILVGMTMALIFREKSEKEALLMKSDAASMPNHITALFFGLMIGILVVNGLQIEPLVKMSLIGVFVISVAALVLFKFKREVTRSWLSETWSFSRMLLPMLFLGVFIAGFVMPLLPESLIVRIVGENTLSGNLVASIFGAFMYFSTLTEIPILQALIAKGMHDGPALALLLAGPSLSLPNMLVIRKVLGTKKTAVYIGLVVLYATAAGMIYGSVV